jgi:hypothetical protein
MLPQSFPNYKTVHRRFQQRCRQEVLRNGQAFAWLVIPAFTRMTVGMRPRLA